MTQWTWTDPTGAVTNLSAWGVGNYVVPGGSGGLLAPEYAITEQEFAGLDGSTPQQIVADAGSPLLAMQFTASDPLELRNRLRALAHALRPKAGIGLLTAVGDDGVSRSLPCYYRKGLGSGVQHGPTYSCVLEFYAPSPWWRGTPLSLNYGLAAPSQFFPFFPMVLAASTIQGQQTIDLSDTDAPTYPRWVVTGPGDTLTLSNTYSAVQPDGTLAQVTQSHVLSSSIGDGQAVIIDTRPGQQSVRAATPVTAATRTNLVPNPSVAVGTQSWFGNAGTGGAVTASRGTGDGPTGGAYYRQTWTTANSTAAGADPLASIVVDGRASATYPIPVTPGATYSAQAQVRSSVAQRLDCRVQWYDAAGTSLGTAAGAAVTVTAGAWTRLTVEGVVAPAGAAYGRVAVSTSAGAGAVPFPVGATLDVTQVVLEPAATSGAYMDGSTASPGGGVTYAWTGAANASSSVQQTPTGGYTLGANLFGNLGADPNLFPLVDGVNVVSVVLTNAGANSGVALTAERLYSGAY